MASLEGPRGQGRGFEDSEPGGGRPYQNRTESSRSVGNKTKRVGARARVDGASAAARSRRPLVVKLARKQRLLS